MTRDELLELAERCEQATRPSRTLDRSIHKAITGKPAPWTDYIPFYTSNEQDAWRVVPPSYAGMLRVRDACRQLDICAVGLRHRLRALAHQKEGR